MPIHVPFNQNICNKDCPLISSCIFFQSETSSVQTYVEAHQDSGHHKRAAGNEADHHNTNGDDHHGGDSHGGDPYGDHGHGFTFQV